MAKELVKPLLPQIIFSLVTLKSFVTIASEKLDFFLMSHSAVGTGYSYSVWSSQILERVAMKCNCGQQIFIRLDQLRKSAFLRRFWSK